LFLAEEAQRTRRLQHGSLSVLENVVLAAGICYTLRRQFMMVANNICLVRDFVSVICRVWAFYETLTSHVTVAFLAFSSSTAGLSFALHFCYTSLLTLLSLG